MNLATVDGNGKTIGREVIEQLIADSNIEKLPKGVKIVAAVSEDVDFSSEMGVIWGIFTRFDAARDVMFTRSTLANISPIHEGIMGIDATWKPGIRTHASCQKKLLKESIQDGENLDFNITARLKRASPNFIIHNL